MLSVHYAYLQFADQERFNYYEVQIFYLVTKATKKNLPKTK